MTSPSAASTKAASASAFTTLRAAQRVVLEPGLVTPDLPLYNPYIGDSASQLEALVGLPTSVDNSAYATPVRDQGVCGGCWGESFVSMMR
jgi:hypothetical protein